MICHPELVEGLLRDERKMKLNSAVEVISTSLRQAQADTLFQIFRSKSKW